MATRIKKGMIFKNLWAGLETYFCYQRRDHEMYAYGYSVIRDEYGIWRTRKSKYYWSDIRDDREHFPIVGIADVDRAITESIVVQIPDTGEKKVFPPSITWEQMWEALKRDPETRDAILEAERIAEKEGE